MLSCGRKGSSDFLMIFVALAFIFASVMFYSALSNPLWSSFEQLILIMIGIVILSASLIAMFKG